MSNNNDDCGGIGIVACIILVGVIIFGFIMASGKTEYQPLRQEIDKSYENNKEFIDWVTE